VSKGTLFIHGSAHSGGAVDNNVAMEDREAGTAAASSECTPACGEADAPGFLSGVSTFCDSSCSPAWSSAGPRLGGHNCGAGQALQYGSNCRMCYTSREEALRADRALASSSHASLPSPDAHVVMCDTGNPPPASECSVECEEQDDTVSNMVKRKWIAVKPLRRVCDQA